MRTPFVAAFDLATKTGCADGSPGSQPRLWTWDLSNALYPGRPARLALLLEAAEIYFGGHPQITHVFYEAPMNIRVMMKRGSSEEVVALLRGSIGVLEAAAAKHNIRDVKSIGVQEARTNLCGGGIPKGQGKETVFRMCKRLGWAPADFEQSDAAAIWAYGGARASPRTAHLTTELFGATK